MSLVICFSGEDFAIVGSDGRATQNDIVVSENAKKFQRIGKHLIVGYAGILEYAEQIVTMAFPSMPYDIIAIDAAHMLESFLNRVANRMLSKFIVCGKNEAGTYETHVILSAPEKVVVRYALPQPGQFSAIGSSVAEDKALEIFLKHLKLKASHIDGILSATIRDISLIDKSVNDHVFLEFV